jgi:hypothetical protein
MDWSKALLLAPGFQRSAHGANRSRRILSSYDRLVEYAFHAAFRGELGDPKRVLLPLVRMAVDIDRIVDTDYVVK